MQADKEQINRLLKTARGQMDGVIKMIEDDRYCIDIVNQLLATQAILKKTTKEILESHLTHCVNDAVREEKEEKIAEIIKVIDVMMK